jgi:2-deoxy-D-gluconate 3-dehydrogenase
VVRDLFNLSGKTALVPGSSGGLGAAIAVALAEAGADVICHGNSRPAAETCRKILQQNGRRSAAIQADLSRPSGAQELFESARSFAPIDIVVNNAGTIKRSLNVPAYAASKGGVAQLTKTLASEWAERGINVNAIAPGYVLTDNTAPLQPDPTRDRQIIERIPAKRWGQPADICGAAVFLCSAASDYVHGHVLMVDGGWMGR